MWWVNGLGLALRRVPKECRLWFACGRLCYRHFNFAIVLFVHYPVCSHICTGTLAKLNVFPSHLFFTCFGGKPCSHCSRAEDRIWKNCRLGYESNCMKYSWPSASRSLMVLGVIGLESDDLKYLEAKGHLYQIWAYFEALFIGVLVAASDYSCIFFLP